MSREQEVVAIVGGAIMGSFVALYLRELGFAGDIIVFERDPSYRRSSTALSAASIRTQFGCAINVRMSLFGAQVLRSIKQRWGTHADIGLVERGYLIIGGPGSAQDRLAAARMQTENGADIQTLDPAQARATFPWLQTDDVEIATYGLRNEGWFDAWALLQLVRDAAKAQRVEYRRENIEQVQCRGMRAYAVRSHDGTQTQADWVVNAAGPASAAILRPLGIDLPVGPRKRTVFRLKAPLSGANFPMLFDNSGAWVRPEGEGFIAGIAPPSHRDPDAGSDFEPDLNQFESELWPALAHRIPAFEELRVESAWAGHYENNQLDHNGIIGPHDEIDNLLFATGFSGHGLMHAPATGRAVAEHIVFGRYQSLDLSPLGYGRIRSNSPLHETIVY